QPELPTERIAIGRKYVVPYFGGSPRNPEVLTQLTAKACIPILQKLCPPQAPVAQLDRAMAYGAIGWGFESLQAYRRNIYPECKLRVPSSGWKCGPKP